MWFLNGVAENQDRPYKKENDNLDPAYVQDYMNSKLIQLLESVEGPAPSLSTEFALEKMARGSGQRNISTIGRKSVRALSATTEVPAETPTAVPDEEDAKHCKAEQ